MSDEGLTALRVRERAVLRYYNDVANNCTYGVGTLAHHGPCTEEELRRPVTPAEVNAQLVARVRDAENAVKRQVRDYDLSQNQFEALVSFTYNVGATGASQTLAAANRGENSEVVASMSRQVYVHPRDARGRRLAAVRVQGLVDRRREEAAPFRDTQGGQ